VSRPKKMRHISIVPVVRSFKPQGIPLRVLERVPLEIDEFEALRLADCLSLSHHNAAERMWPQPDKKLPTHWYMAKPLSL
jgi:predicted DNA-binding protein (UPF0251 family)